MWGFPNRLLLIALAVVPLLAVSDRAGAAEHAGPSIEIVQIHPTLFGQLAGPLPVFLRLAYRSEQPVRFRIEGLEQGNLVAESRSNPKPLHPAGEGEALVWIEFAPPAAIDELRITMLDGRSQPLAIKTARARLRWVRAVRTAEPARPDWVSRLDREQQALAAVPEPALEDAGGGLIPDEWVLPMAWIVIFAYIVLQIPMAIWLTGKWRLAARAPLLVTVPLLLYTIGAFTAGSALWPLAALLLTPFVLVYLMALLVVRFVADRMAAE